MCNTEITGEEALTVTSNSAEITVKLSQTSLTDLGSFMQHALDCHTVGKEKA